MAEEIEERGLRAKIRDVLSRKYRSATVLKVIRIIERFKTVEEFCRAQPGEWLAKYRDARPNSQHDIGKVCMKALDDAVAYVREERRQLEIARVEKERADNEARAAEEEAKRKAEEEEERRNPKFTLQELKSLVSFMDLCDIASIDLKKIKNFLTMIDAKVKGS